MAGELTVDEAWAHWDAMVAAASRVLRNRDAATECAMQAVVQVLEQRPASVANPEAFLVTVAKRRAVDAVRRDVRERKAMARARALHSHGELDVADGVCDQLEAAWLDATARHALDPQVYALLGQIADGQSVADAAALLGMTVKAAESHLVRARRLLRTAAATALAGLLAVLAGLRRAALPATPALALAVAAATVMVTQPGTSASAPTLAPEVEAVRHVPAPATHRLPVAQAPSAATGGTVARSATTHVATPVSAPAQQFARPYMTSQKTLVATPAGRVVTGTYDDGYHSRGPVDTVKHCVDTVMLTVHDLGCR